MWQRLHEVLLDRLRAADALDLSRPGVPFPRAVQAIQVKRRCSPRRRSALAWVSDRIQRYGVSSVVGVRFVPGGRGKGVITAGIVDLSFRGFLLAACLSEIIFVTCTIGLGYLGGRLVPGGASPAPGDRSSPATGSLSEEAHLRSNIKFIDF
uniref:DedA family protein n=1 Tax=Nonomuraea pusilla TaxID=46177 RepID=UPI000AC3F1CB|nr:VTT domain-containing protein [Nonomuraea pusilla]